MINLDNGWKTVLGGFLIHLVLGTLYCWANITSAVTSYLRKYDSSVEYNHTIMVYAAALAAQGSTMLIGGILSQRIGARLCCAIGGGVLVTGTFLASVSSTATNMILSQGVCLGIGLGLCYTGPIAASVKWMPNRKGMVTGIIVGGFGCGAFVFGLLATSVVNPDHTAVEQSGPNKNYFSADSSVVQNVPLMFRVLGVVYICVLSLGCFLLREPPKSPLDAIESHSTHALLLNNEDQPKSNIYQSTMETNERSPAENPLVGSTPANQRLSNRAVKSSNFDALEMINLKDESKVNADVDIEDNKKKFKHLTPQVDDVSDGLSDDNEDVEFGPKEILSLPLAWHLASCFITTTVGGMYIAGTFKVFGQTKFSDEQFLSVISSLASIFNSSGRIFWGSIADYLGAMKTLIIMGFIFSFVIASYPSSVLFGKIGFTLWTFMIFFFEGANFVLYVPMTVLLFGNKNSASNYGLIFSSYSLFTVINIFILSGAEVPFNQAALLMGGLTFLGFINLLLLNIHIKRNKRVKAAGCSL